MVFFKSPRHELDPLDVEILHRAFEATWATIKASGQSFDFESDEALEAALRRELIEIARFNGKRPRNSAGHPLGDNAAGQARVVSSMPRRAFACGRRGTVKCQSQDRGRSVRHKSGDVRNIRSHALTIRKGHVTGHRTARVNVAELPKADSIG